MSRNDSGRRYSAIVEQERYEDVMPDVKTDDDMLLEQCLDVLMLHTAEDSAIPPLVERLRERLGIEPDMT